MKNHPTPERRGAAGREENEGQQTPLDKAQVAQARNMSIGEHRHCCVTFKYKDLYGKKTYRFCNLDAMLLSPNSFDSQEPVPVAKNLFFLSQNEPKKKRHKQTTQKRSRLLDRGS